MGRGADKRNSPRGPGRSQGRGQRGADGQRSVDEEVRISHDFFFQAEDGIRDIGVTGVQTCALPISVSRLARSQERELRAWLYDPKVVREGGTWAGLVAQMVADVEADHALLVDPVVVGDAPVDEPLAALGAATREALVNAAKHSGATAADLYTEVTPERVSVYVRDRGKGFDPAEVPDDRRGLRDSVSGRLTRLGGTAVVRSAPGDGTEVELVLPRGASS